MPPIGKGIICPVTSRFTPQRNKYQQLERWGCTQKCPKSVCRSFVKKRTAQFPYRSLWHWHHFANRPAVDESFRRGFEYFQSIEGI
jgi:hypothetical protein